MDMRLMETILKPACSIAARMAAVWSLRTASGLMMLNVRCDMRCFSTPEGSCLIRISSNRTGNSLHSEVQSWAQSDMLRLHFNLNSSGADPCQTSRISSPPQSRRYLSQSPVQSTQQPLTKSLDLAL